MGTTAVVINERELTCDEVALLSSLGVIMSPGRYWLLSDGTYGEENGYAIGRLATDGRQVNCGSYDGTGWTSRNGYTDIGAGGNADGCYFIGSDWSCSTF